MDVFTKMDLDIEAADIRGTSGYHSFIRAYGSAADTYGDVVFEVHEFDDEEKKWKVSRVAIPKEPALKFAAVVAGQCALDE